MPEKPSIPEYYRHLAGKGAQGESVQGEEGSAESQETPALARSASPPEPRPPSSPVTPSVPGTARRYQADTFSVGLPLGWQDKTVYFLTGPVSDGLQHNVTVTLDPDVPAAMTPEEYADVQVRSLEGELQGCRVLLRDAVALDSGHPAQRVIFRWEPSDALRVYQEQFYVLDGGVGYKLTATFTKKTRKTLGPGVSRMMRSFVPQPPPADG